MTTAATADFRYQMLEDGSVSIVSIALPANAQYALFSAKLGEMDPYVLKVKLGLPKNCRITFLK